MAGGSGCNGDKLAAGLQLFFIFNFYFYFFFLIFFKVTFSAIDHVPKCPREKLLLFRHSSHNIR